MNKGAGYADAGGVSSLDLAGNPRTWTTTADIGAWEFQYEIQPATVIFFR